MKIREPVKSYACAHVKKDISIQLNYMTSTVVKKIFLSGKIKAAFKKSFLIFIALIFTYCMLIGIF